MRRTIAIMAAGVVLGACGSSSGSSTTGVGDAEPSSTTIVETTTTTRAPDIGPNTPSGYVVLDGLPGATEKCSTDGDRKIAVDWRGPEEGYVGSALPLHMSFTGAGGNYAGPHPFDWQAGAGLIGKDNLEGAFSIVVRFECMNSPEFPKLSSGPQAMFYLSDLGMNPHDVNYVYELLCTDLHRGTADADKIVPIDTAQIDCSRVGLRGHSGGAFTAIMFLNECFETMSITPHIEAIATVVGGFFPFGSCTVPGETRFGYRFDAGIPLFMKVACEDFRVPYGAYVRDQWQKMGAPKFLYSRNGGHSENDGPGGKDAVSARLLSGEGLIQIFMRTYLLGDEGPTGLEALDDFPDVTPAEGFTSSFQYDGPFGTSLDGGIC